MANGSDVVLKKDALEAFNSFRVARNLFFVLLFFPLLAIQAGFWAVDREFIDCGAAAVEVVEKTADISAAEETKTKTVVSDSWQDKVACQVETIIEPAINMCNIVLIFSAVIYMLILFSGLALAMIGQLGGLADASRAFFLALIMAIFIVPWIKLVSADLPITSFSIFSYEDLVVNFQQKQVMENGAEIAQYYGRFCGLWGISFILLLAAQLRSRRSVRQVKDRLASLVSGIIPDMP